ncbi:hypothetical protein VTK56DRAFT_3015 [Thermocarpiscus australiensis]
MASPSSIPPPPLPGVPGPKLAPFTATARAEIEFVECLGHPKDKDAYVWKVEIDGSLYALKMFQFRELEYLWKCSYPLNRDLAKPQFYFDYCDPFSCECRVYGRLKKEGREDLAVKAYGYLLLTPQQEGEITRRITGQAEPGEEEAEEVWGRFEQHHGQPVRAIVKELISDDDGDDRVEEFDRSQIPRMCADLDELHSLGILVRDIHLCNYLRGKLVDFSRAWTMYHPSLDQFGCRQHLETLNYRDSFELFETIDAVYCWDAAEMPQYLREYVSGRNKCPIDVTKYNWRQKDGEEVEEHVRHELFAEGSDEDELVEA